MKMFAKLENVKSSVANIRGRQAYGLSINQATVMATADSVSHQLLR
jgi:hypothetical protein